MPDQYDTNHAKLVGIARQISHAVDYLVGQMESDSTEEVASEFLGSVLTNHESAAGYQRQSHPPLPAPGLVKKILKRRATRGKFFDAFAEDLFSDPAWEMLLDLTIAHAEHRRVSVTSLCIASGVPPTTALRWINLMVEVGLLQRLEDETDRRRTFIALTERAISAIARYFREAYAPEMV